jgi:hypothetical protein
LPRSLHRARNEAWSARAQGARHGLSERNGARGWLQRVSDGQHKAGRRARATTAMAGRHCAQAVATTTRLALSLSWAWEDLAGWAASWATWKQREGQWNGGAGQARLGVQPGFSPLPNRVRKSIFFFQSFHNLQTNLNSIQI